MRRTPLPSVLLLIGLTLLVGLGVLLGTASGNRDGDDGRAAEVTAVRTAIALSEYRARFHALRRQRTAVQAATLDTPVRGSSVAESDVSESVAWTLHLVDPEGRDVPGLQVNVGKRSVSSNGEGIVELGQFAIDDNGQGRVEVSSDGLVLSPVLLTSPQTTLTTRPTVPVLVTIHDGVNGADVPGTRVSLRLKDTTLPLNRTTRGHETAVAALFRNDWATLHLRVEPPSGYVVDEHAGGLSFPSITRYTERLDVPVVLRRCAKIRVRVLSAEGEPVEGAHVLDARSDGRWISSGEATSDSDGILNADGVAFYRDEPVTLTIGTEDRFVVARPVFMRRVDEQHDLEVRLPAAPCPWNGDFSFSGSASSSIGCGRRSLSEGTGRITFFALRRNGEPARGARVRLDRVRSVQADDEGRGTFDKLAAGTYTLQFDEPGIVDTSVSVRVQEDVTTRTDLIEGPGRSLDVVVRNEFGTPLPFAEVRIGGGSSRVRSDPILTGNVQPVRFLTDADGRLRLEHLPHRSCRVIAQYGGREAQQSAEDGEATLELTLRLPEDRD